MSEQMIPASVITNHAKKLGGVFEADKEYYTVKEAAIVVSLMNKLEEQGK